MDMNIEENTVLLRWCVSRTVAMKSSTRFSFFFFLSFQNLMLKKVDGVKEQT